MKKLALFIPLVLLNLGMQRDAAKDTQAVVKASYIYNIAKLIDWKDAKFKEGNFVIGIMSESNIYQELIKKYSSRSIGKQPIEVRKLARSANVGPCHILFVPRSALDLMPDIYQNIQKSGTLIITEYPGALSDGAVVNFTPSGGTVKYELNVPNASAQGIEVGSTLKQLAIKVEDQ